MLIPRRTESNTESTPWVLMVLIAVNCAIYAIPFLIYHNLQGEAWENAVKTYYYTYGLVPTKIRPSAIFTSMFLHGGLGHLLSNMYFLYLFGVRLEERLGKLLFSLAYIACGVFGALLHVVMFKTSGVPCVGASGAISGIMALNIVVLKRETLELVWLWEIFRYGEKEDSFRMSSTSWILMWTISQLWVGVLTIHAAELLSVAVWAHIGGVIAGILLGVVFKVAGFAEQDQPEPIRERKNSFVDIAGYLHEQDREAQTLAIAEKKQKDERPKARYLIQRADFAQRVLAAVIDFGVAAVASGIVLFCYYGKSWPARPWAFGDQLQIGVIIGMVSMICTCPELVLGLSAGKWLTGLRIYSNGGDYPSLAQLIWRWMVKHPCFTAALASFVITFVLSVFAGVNAVLIGIDPKAGGIAAFSMYARVLISAGVIGEIVIILGFLLALFPEQLAVHDMLSGTRVYQLVADDHKPRSDDDDDDDGSEDTTHRRPALPVQTSEDQPF